MTVNRKGNGASKTSLLKYKVIRIGDIAFEGHTSKKFAFGRFVLNDVANGIMSPRFICLRPIHPQIIQFWKQYIHYEPILRPILIRSTKLGTMMNELVVPDLLKQNIRVPSINEQKLIGKSLSRVDNLIAATQGKLDHFEEIKKALLQHLFDQSMRFKGYSDPWEKRKLGSIGKIKSGSGFPSIEQGGKQGIPFYKVSDMNTSGNENSMVISQNYVTSTQLKKRKWTPITNTPAIIFAKVGAAIFLDRKRVVEHPFLIDNNMMAYIVGDAWNLRFCQAFFQSIPLLKFAQTGALPSLNAHDIGRIPVHLPTRYEQKEIGDLIYKVTHLIAATQSKLSNLETLKKALLQGLFI